MWGEKLSCCPLPALVVGGADAHPVATVLSGRAGPLERMQGPSLGWAGQLLQAEQRRRPLPALEPPAPSPAPWPLWVVATLQDSLVLSVFMEGRD